MGSFNTSRLSRLSSTARGGVGALIGLLAVLAPLALIDSKAERRADRGDLPSLPIPTPTLPAIEPTGESRRSTFPEGRGPFILYALERHVFALDLGSKKSDPVLLGPDYQPYYYGKVYGNGELIALPDEDGALSLISRSGIRRDLYRDERGVRAVAVSPDGFWVAEATFGSDQFSTQVLLHRVDGSRPARKLTSFSTSSDDSGGAFQLFWRDEQNVIILDRCHCDGGPGHSRTFNLSVASGELREVQFLEERDPYELGPQLGGSRVVFDDVPSVDCFEVPDPCGDLTHSLMVADLENGSLRRLARSRKVGFASPQISPDGSIVAASIWKSRDLVFRDSRSGAEIGSLKYEAQLIPESWIGNDLLIASAYPDEDTHILLAVSIDRASGSATVRKLISDNDAVYLGWIW